MSKTAQYAGAAVLLLALIGWFVYANVQDRKRRHEEDLKTIEAMLDEQARAAERRLATLSPATMADYGRGVRAAIAEYKRKKNEDFSGTALFKLRHQIVRLTESTIEQAAARAEGKADKLEEGWRKQLEAAAEKIWKAEGMTGSPFR